MSKKLTTQEFVERAIKTHGEAYDYSESEYKTAKDKVKIFCKSHNQFFYQSSTNHLSGQGCPKCSLIKSAKTRSKTREQFIADCVAVHGDSYDYSDLDYHHAKGKVRIKCKKHNSYFNQKADNHLAGKGCPACGYEKISSLQTSNLDRFLEKATLVHGTKYVYDKTVYVTVFKKVTITCRIHGDYEQYPSDHMSGQGCPKCKRTGYNTSKPGCLYILQCGDITKIGITNRLPSIRARNVSKSYGAEFLVKYYWEFDDGSVPNDIETALLRELRSSYTSPLNKFDGSSECFLNVNHLLLLELINQEIMIRNK